MFFWKQSLWLYNFRQLKADLFTILDRFVEQAAMLDSLSVVSSRCILHHTNSWISDSNWRVFLKRFSTSVQHITGQEIEVKEPGESDSRDTVVQELESLRIKVEELSDEVNPFIACYWQTFWHTAAHRITERTQWTTRRDEYTQGTSSWNTSSEPE